MSSSFSQSYRCSLFASAFVLRSCVPASLSPSNLLPTSCLQRLHRAWHSHPRVHSIQAPPLTSHVTWMGSKPSVLCLGFPIPGLLGVEWPHTRGTLGTGQTADVSARPCVCFPWTPLRMASTSSISHARQRRPQPQAAPAPSSSHTVCSSPCCPTDTKQRETQLTYSSASLSLKDATQGQPDQQTRGAGHREGVRGCHPRSMGALSPDLHVVSAWEAL